MNILVVDDEILVREALSDFIEDQLGHAVTQSESADDALALLGNHQYPLILTDIRMPGMDGIELLRRVRSTPRNATSEIIVITGHGDDSTEREVREAGALEYLEKPIDILQLAEIICEIATRSGHNGNR